MSKTGTLFLSLKIRCTRLQFTKAQNLTVLGFFFVCKGYARV